MQQNKKIAIQIEGMTCQSCANRIEKVLNRNDFVSDAGVNFAAEEAHVVFVLAYGCFCSLTFLF